MTYIVNMIISNRNPIIIPANTNPESSISYIVVFYSDIGGITRINCCFLNISLPTK